MNNLKYITLSVALILMLPDIAGAQTKSFLDSSISGFTEPYRSIEIAAPEMGTISEITVNEGDIVERGSVLARLDEAVLKASLEMARQSSEAKGKLKSKFAELNLQEKRFEKLVGLQQRRHASQTEIDRAKSQLEIAKAQVEAVEDELRIKTYEMKRIEAQLEQRRLRSPINGIVTEITKDQGEFVSANDPVVLRVVQLDPLMVVFSIPQDEARKMAAGNTLPIKIGLSKEQASGFIEFVSPTADAQSGTCRVKMRIDNPGYKWQSGVSCQLETSSIAAIGSKKHRSTQIVTKTK